MRLLTWNLNARTNAAGVQAETILALDPDIAVLQEVTPRAWAVLRAALAERGYGWSAAGGGAPEPSARGVAAISRLPFGLVDGHRTSRPDLLVHLRLRGPKPFDVLGVHVPTRAAAAGWMQKVLFQEALLHTVRTARRPLIVAGDLNAPKAERGPGDVVAFTPRSRTRAHAAELGLHAAPEALGLCDAFRQCNGYDCGDISWQWKNRGRTGGYRLDHILASPALAPRACWYDHGVRERGLSDHSVMVADFDGCGA